MKIIKIFLISLFSCVVFSAAFAKSRPPQFVLISFDNAMEIPQWQRIADFLSTMKQSGKDIHFTFFVSGTNFLTDKNKKRYQGPMQTAGEAEIGFGGSKEEVLTRLNYMNTLYHHGNEIGSHVVGHFDGGKWSFAEWKKEFDEYENLFTKIESNNQLPAHALRVPLVTVSGFRAPYLSENSVVNRVLRIHHFRYDASGIGEANAWPQKLNGIWYFNLARLKMAGTHKKTISMDYNFFVRQPNAGPKVMAKYRQQMYNTYLQYFLSNYNGNRAPVIIGHHFKNFNNGIYNQALLAFAEKVCGLPEVKCTTFSKLADYLDGLDKSFIPPKKHGSTH